VILVDTSIWVSHFRAGDDTLVGLLRNGMVLAHPFVTGEIAMGNIRQRDLVLADLQDLPQAVVAEDGEVMDFIGAQRLFGLGIGYVDAHLLAAARLTPSATLWTRDNRLNSAARTLGLAAAV
jgi:predicted nucleic acid-binding protein